MSERNDNIIKKIKGLLAIARDHKSDEESQSAFILAQKLMKKHNITIGEVDHEDAGKKVEKGQATAHKKLSWWETELARTMAKNFRVKFYFNNDRSGKQTKRAIVFMGFESDVLLAKEMYVLAYDVLTYYTQRYVKNYYLAKPSQPRTITNELKNSYMQGFLAGLADKFEEQVKEMEQEWGLMVLVPQEVNDEYNKMFGKKKGGGVTFQVPNVAMGNAYSKGYNQGNRVDYTKSTIDG
jgi:hypothetical protein